MIRRVVKVGGSLLTRPDLAQQVLHWTQSQPAAENWFLFGGGEVIDAIRRLDKIHSFDASSMHWVCVNLLDASFQIASQLLTRSQRQEDSQPRQGWNLITTPEQFQACCLKKPAAGNHLVQCSVFYHPHQPSSLPQDWRTTTDSIAALLADYCQADELVLLKSCSVDPTDSVTQLSMQGIVDEAFPMACKLLPVIRIERLG